MDSFIGYESLCLYWIYFSHKTISFFNDFYRCFLSDAVNIVHIQETDLYDTLSTTKEALRTMRMQQEIANNNDNNDDSNNKGKSKKIILYHAMLGRYLGGGIAFIDTICDSKWGFGVTSDLSGTLREIDENVLFDFFIFIHEVGHSLGAGKFS